MARRSIEKEQVEENQINDELNDNVPEDFELTDEVEDERPSFEEAKAMAMAKAVEIKEERAAIVRSERKYKNPLRNERICVRHIYRESPMFNSPKHVFAGGIADNAVKTFCVPMTSQGSFKKVLEDEEANFLEDVMGLEPNTLSIYRKKDNFWESTNKAAVVELGKADVWLDLSSPDDYIKYKILLANDDLICPSLMELKDRPKATYEFVIVAQAEEHKTMKASMSNKAECYKFYGKHEEDKDVLRMVCQLVEGKPQDAKATIDFYQSKFGDLIEKNTKMLLNVIRDEKLDTKVFIQNCLEKGLISKRNNLYFLTKDKTPLCHLGKESTLSNAAIYLDSPEAQEIRYTLETNF